MWTKAEALKTLEKEFGIEAVDEFMAASHYETHELQDVVKHLYGIYGRLETNALFEVLGKVIPLIEESDFEKGKRHLDTFTKTLWTHHFSEDSLLDYIEVGTNHIVLYPKPTDIGRRLLACLVGTMWHPANKKHFNPYACLKTSEAENCISFVLDHAKYKYSNRDFNRHNGPDLLSHFHPVSGGSYHTHFYYEKQFPGLLALYSILKVTHNFIDEKDTELKEIFEKEILESIDHFSHHIIDTLMGLLPPPLEFYENSTLIKIGRLQTLLLFIKDNGLFDEGLLDYEIPEFTEADYDFLSEGIECKDTLIQQMLRNFLFDLHSYQDNLKKFKSIAPLVDDEFVPLTSCETIKRLFQLSCCLTSKNQSPLEPLSVEELRRKKAETLADSEEEDGSVLDGIDEAILLADLRKVAGINHQSLLALREQHKAVCSPATETTAEANVAIVHMAQQVDYTMVGYRQRVAHAMQLTDYSFTFSLTLLRQGEITKPVDRSDTKTALSTLTANSAKPSVSVTGKAAPNKTPSIRGHKGLLFSPNLKGSERSEAVRVRDSATVLPSPRASKLFSYVH